MMDKSCYQDYENCYQERFSTSGVHVVKKAISALYAAVTILILTGCQTESIDNSRNPPELVIVSEQISATQRYDIDLTREDAIYFIAPGLPASRLSVTCPTLATISFAEYVVSRIRPTGVKYDPTTHILRLANIAVPFEGVEQIDGQGAESCVVDCWDGGVKEQCIICSANE